MTFKNAQTLKISRTSAVLLAHAGCKKPEYTGESILFLLLNFFNL